MIKLISLITILLTIYAQVIHASAKHEDCEKPPEVENASVTVRIDENEDFATATYRCSDGYKLNGKAIITCDLDTDEWQENPPTCELQQNSEENDEKSSADNVRQQRRKGKVHEIKEETQITNDFARDLDLSCMSKGLVKAPTINNGYIAKYNRRRKGEKLFLVAFYECDEDYELENLEHDRLYCSKERWVGDTPQCISINDEGEDDEEDDENGGEDYSDENGNVSGGESEDEKEQKHRHSHANEISTTTTTTTTTTTASHHDHHHHNNEIEESTSATIKSHLERPCDTDNGGCDHECQMVIDDDDTEPRIQCSCRAGYTLDESDGRRCHDIDECDDANHGCEQICKNLPGSFECLCHHGLQIDNENNKKCIDINECLENPSICGDYFTCENSYGTYTCIEPPTTTSTTTTTQIPITSTTAKAIEEDNEELEEEDDDIEDNRRRGETSREEEEGEDDDDEGNKSETEERKDERGEERESEINKIPEAATTTTSSKSESEDDKRHFEEDEDEDKERNEIENSIETREDIDIDNEIPEAVEHSTPEPTTTTTTTTTRTITHYAESENENENEIESGEDSANEDEHEEKHKQHHHHSDDEIEHTRLHHQSSTVKSDLRNECDDGWRLDDTGNCVVVVIDEREEEEDHRRVNEKEDDESEEETEVEQTSLKSIHIENEHISTSTSTTTSTEIKPECQHVDDGVECECPQGYELSEDESHCQDINECEIYGGSDDEEDEEDEENVPKASFCSHSCINHIGSFQCTCPENFHIHDDKRTCIRDFCIDLENSIFNKTKCSHECVDGHEGYICRCPTGWSLQNDLKTCKQEQQQIEHHEHESEHERGSKVEEEKQSSESDDDYYENNEVDSDIVECRIHDHEQCSPGNCVIVKHHHSGKEQRQCQCPSGFQSHDNKCIDIDECIRSDNDEVAAMHRCSHDCHNTFGSYYCSCPHGLTLSDDRETCIDFDECSHDKNICGDLTCLNTYGSFKCLCENGEDADEYGKCQKQSLCDNNNGGCSHSCRIHQNEIICECPDDMDLSEDDMRTCVAIDPCHIDNGGCSHYCDSSLDPMCYCPPDYTLNHDDKRTCKEDFKCKHGYQLSSHDGAVASCMDIDECEEDRNICVYGECENVEGSYTCHCHYGYELAEGNKTCIDIDECSNQPCSHRCLNLPGTYQCLCSFNQVLMADGHTCGFSDLCDLNNGGCAHECDFVDNKISCSCRKGYKVDDVDEKNCVDVDECLENNGSCQHECINTEGSFYCSCNGGYELSKNSFSCIDIDECVENNGNCTNICINLIGSKMCACEAGYMLDVDNHTCLDIDECQSQSMHDCSHICINTDGTYACDCPGGYRLAHDKFNCHDINECEEQDIACINGLCKNTNGSYICECERGYELADDRITCIDIDECNNKEHECSHHCINIAGGYKCSCPAGLELNEDSLSCRDIDECEYDSPCEHICENTEGSFICKCYDGYELSDDEKSCIDVDECRLEMHECEGLCTNTEGNYTCSCPKDLILATDGRRCENPDLCAFNNGGCSQLCEFHNNHIVCSCRKGFAVDEHERSQCNDINECTSEVHSCQQHCVNTVGSYRCECHPGFRMNENEQCIDIDECKMGNFHCPHTANCINTAGSYKCVCPNGFKLARDKTTCIEIKNECKPLIVKNGHARCTRSRHKTQLFYRTKCAISCDKGYKLHGPSIKHCNGTGHWDDYSNPICMPLACPRLEKPEYGTILPANCMYGDTFAGERCFLHCPSGYKALGKRVALCNNNLEWQPKAELQCIQVRAPNAQLTSSTAAAVAALHTQQFSHQSRPTIKCPEDMTIVKPKNHETILVRIEKPETNVDWDSFVDAQPVWGKNLEATLPVGATEITYRARSPYNQMFDICRVIINVIDPTPPIVSHCPEPFVVHLQPHETTRPIHWKEPSFESKQAIKHIFKSKVPGHNFAAGVHVITYLATTQEGLSAKCTFRITVKGTSDDAIQPPSHHHKTPLETNLIAENQEKPHHPHHHRQQQQPMSQLKDHESFLICPGQRPIKIATRSQPWHLPRGCVIKNVKVRRNRIHNQHHQQQQQQQPNPMRKHHHPQAGQHQQHHHHRHEHAAGRQLNEEFSQAKNQQRQNRLRYYSSWDNQKQQQQQQQQQSENKLHPQHHNRIPNVQNKQQFYHAYAPAAHWD